jgi:transposase-like protein
MDFPITNLLDHEASTNWIREHFHPEGLKCPRCQAGVEAAGVFRQTKRSRLTVYRCRHCDKTYNLYTGTVFEARHLRPAQVVLVLRGVCQGKSAAQIAREVGIGRNTATDLRHLLQANAERLQPTTPLPDNVTETDEMFQNAGEKRRGTPRPSGPAALSRQQETRAWDVCQ